VDTSNPPAFRFKSLWLLFLATGVLLSPTSAAEPVSQPIRFNHKLHITDVGLECTECHRTVTTGRKATLPPKGVCGECHSEAIGESPEEEKLVEILNSEERLDWQRIYVLPKHVYFSHFRHVALGQIDCVICHGEMRKLTSPPRSPAVDTVNMKECIRCHKQRQASVDCLACHD